MGQNLVMTGMVLNAMPIGDYDKRITLLTRERGKITAFARGARKPNSQFLAATNPFSFGEFELFEGRSTYTVAKVSIQNYFRELAADFNAAYYGFYFLEFADYYCQENNDETEMLKLLYQTLRALESPAFSNRLVRCIYELKTLTINGEAPNVFGCTKCGKKEALHWFSGKTARMLCDHCVNELRRKPENMAASADLSESAGIHSLYHAVYYDSKACKTLHVFCIRSGIVGITAVYQGIHEILYQPFF